MFPVLLFGFEIHTFYPLSDCLKERRPNESATIAFKDPLNAIITYYIQYIYVHCIL